MVFEAQKTLAWQQKLEETLLLLHRLQTEVEDVELKRRPEEGEWSAAEILAHLRSCQDVWSYSIYAMLLSPEPALAYVHPRPWTKLMQYELLPFAASLDGFESDRRDLLRILGSLKEQDWESSATIKGRTHSVFSQIRRMAKHEEEHWPQLESFID